MHKKEYERVTMHTCVFSTEDIVSTSGATTTNYDGFTSDIYGGSWTDGNAQN